MNILSIHCSHHASVSIASDNKLVAHSELSRFNKQKYTPWPDINVIKKIQSLNLEYDVVLFSKLPDNCFPMYDQKLLKQMGVKDNAQIHISDEHHLFHAACGRSFKNNFDNYFVWDCNGALINVDGHQGTETYSLWNSKLDLQKRILTSILILPISIYFLISGGYQLIFFLIFISNRIISIHTSKNLTI